MLLPDTAERDPAGRLRVGGCDVGALAATHGTPLYIFDEQTMRQRLRDYRGALAAWPSGGRVLYSAKAYLGAAMVRLLVDEGCGVDVVSGAELATVLRYGMAPADVGFPGNNKDAGEVRAAWDAGVGHLVVDSLRELDLCAALPAGRRLTALLRISPGVRPDTIDRISTGQLDSKFGFSVENGTALEALRVAMRIPSLDVVGVHMHIGSQILELRSHAAAVGVAADLCRAARDRVGLRAGVLSVGGGLGIAHVDADDPPTVLQFMSMLTTSIEAEFSSRGLGLPAVHVEPGRSVAGPAALAVYTVGARKEIPGVRTYVAVDGGMADNIRPKLYDAVYQPIAVVEPPGLPVEEVTLAGRYCESTDILVERAVLPRLSPGDLVALPAAGAYTLSMASNYNAALRPAVVFVRDGIARLVRRRETLDDLLRTEIDLPGAEPARDGG